MATLVLERHPLGRIVGAILLAGGTLLAGCAEDANVTYFRELDAAYLADGRLRTDRLARNVPYSNADLAEHFRRVAFGRDVEFSDGQLVFRDNGRGDPLKRWKGPIRYRLSGAVRSEDRAAMAEIVDRLARRTQLDIHDAGNDDANLMVHFLGARGRSRLAEAFARLDEPSPQQEIFDAWRLEPLLPCLGEFYYHPPEADDPFVIDFAAIYIPDEMAGLSRRACIEEELSQTLGLSRDDPAVRPSIFNDDEEFALLTEHDEYLLRILYDPRLKPGMTARQAMPIVRRIASELRPWLD